MKLSNATIALLKNFAAINSNIFIPAGNSVKTMSVVGNILGSAVIDEEFTSAVSIYDLGEFLSVYAMAPDGEIELHNEFLVVKWGSSKVRYSFADPVIMRNAIAASEKRVKFPDPEIEFDLSAEMLSAIHKSASVLKNGHLSVYSDNNKVLIKTFDKSNINSNIFTIETGVDTEYTFDMVFDIANLKIQQGNYKVSISKRNISRFVKQGEELEYFISLDVSSKFAG